MCTLSWIHDRQGCRIYFNRDEKRTRSPARPPKREMVDDVNVLTPADGNYGGSWLTVNEYGVAVAVLNYYEAEANFVDKSARFESRGHLVLKLSSSRSLSEASDRLKKIHAESYRPFILLIFNGEGQARMTRWDGQHVSGHEIKTMELPITTSSFKTPEVIARRHEKFREFRSAMSGEPDSMLSAFHHSRDGLGGPYSVTMTRPDALTVSFSMVTIGGGHVSFFYQPRQVDGADPEYLAGTTVTLSRA
jgi:hypothetical protein